MNNSLNEGRESLWELELDRFYLVEGNASGIFSTMKSGVSRYALSEVLIKPYDVTIQYAQLPVIAFAQHLNCIRKDDGMEMTDWTDGKRQYLVGKVEEYETKGVPRRSMKFFRDANISIELRKIEKRIRGLCRDWRSINEEEQTSRMRGCLKMLERVATMIETYTYVPWQPQPVLRIRLAKCKEAVLSLEELV